MDCLGEECLPPSLTTLEIVGCEKLERWITSKGLQSEGLTHLILGQWKEVKWFPREGCLPASLKSLQLSNFLNLEMLDCKGLHHLTSLQQLKIEYCPKLTISEPLQHKSLKEIHVSDVTRCDSLTLFPLGSLPKLEALFISKCHRLISMPGLGFAAPHLEKLEIAACPEMDCFGEKCLPPSLKTLRIVDCEKLERWITSKGLQSQGLTHLFLENWNEVKWFPREGCLPASLQSLKLSYFSNLETLDCKGLHHLTSLQQLTIDKCPKLENITQQNLPASISKLLIRGECPLWSKLEEMNDPRIQFRKGKPVSMR
ncbi:hypothetical protein Ahy_A02g005777 [Arachis hypogaea]|uniref:Disease resistance protein n=1 Tax=Arachis hypogaea TaxID=3818 RepID=A0A445E8C7_ARAHY|nr:hypothetical protein Ahy_A02g005777 [Arachis hypogaea]